MRIAVKFNEPEKHKVGWYELKNDGKTIEKIIEEAFVMTYLRDDPVMIGDEQATDENGDLVYISVYTIVPSESYILQQQELQSALFNKQEAYTEYLELEKMLGADSVEALAAKDAYLRINETSPDKCRYELEVELADANTDRDYYFGMLLEDGGMWG